MLKADHVVKFFRDSTRTAAAVKETTLELKPGEFCVLVGESGCGKSTLSRLLSGILKPDQGDVLLDGKSIIPPARRKDRRICADIQLVLQDSQSALDPRYTVYQSIAEPIRNLSKVSKTTEKETVYRILIQTGLSADIANRHARDLSGGQQKRVCIARALAASPRYLIFDEAVSGLDVLVKAQILDLIRDLHAQTGACYLMITHDMDVALYLASRILVMKDGEIVEDRAFAGKTSCFTHPYTRLLLEQMKPFAKVPDEEERQ